VEIARWALGNTQAQKTTAYGTPEQRVAHGSLRDDLFIFSLQT